MLMQNGGKKKSNFWAPRRTGRSPNALGRSLFSVQNKRLKLGLPMLKPAHRHWTEAEIKMIGTMPDHDLARKLGRHPSTVVSKRLAMKIPYAKPRYVAWRPEEEHLLGKIPDDEIAELIGRPVKAVRLKRFKLGIPNRFDKRKRPRTVGDR
jgi:hypothetical protein